MLTVGKEKSRNIGRLVGLCHKTSPEKLQKGNSSPTSSRIWAGHKVEEKLLKVLTIAQDREKYTLGFQIHMRRKLPPQPCINNLSLIWEKVEQS